MHHEIQRGEHASILPSAVDLFDPAPDAVAHHGRADLAAGGDPDPGMPELVRNKIENRQRAVAPASRPVAPEIVRSAPQPLFGEQALAILYFVPNELGHPRIG